MKKTLERMVWSVLKHFPETRNSDVALTIEIWKNFYPAYLKTIDGEVYVKAKYLFVLPREDHVKRIRAKIQNVNRQWLPTDVKIFIERIKLSEEWKEFLGYTPNWTGRELINKAEMILDENKVKESKLF